MQKIVIKNFGAIKDAEIEIKKILLLIGEQASGKSTIAKLIYFFKSIRDELFNGIYKDNSFLEDEYFIKTYKEYSKEEYLFKLRDEEFENRFKKFNLKNDLFIPVKNKYELYFGQPTDIPEFKITYYYNVEKDYHIYLTIDLEKKLFVEFSPNLKNEIETNATKIKKEGQKSILKKNLSSNFPSAFDKIIKKGAENNYIKNISDFVNNLFDCHQSSSLYVIAGRNATVSYSDLFEKYLFANTQNKIENIKSSINSINDQAIDEILMLDFIERISKIKSVFKKHGSFEKLITSNLKKDELPKKDFLNLEKKISAILKGKYILEQYGGNEKIIINNKTGQTVHLHNSSSGQQEVIRILQDIFLTLIEKQKALRVIEEPEAHLFPVAQKLVVELLAYFVNQGNELIITTHSPYVLTVFNNLLFAGRVVEKNSNSVNEVDEIIENDIRLKQIDFAAYSLTGNVQDIAEGVYCENIVNQETGLINQNYLDTVSEILSGDFNKLYSIHSKSFARK